MTKQIESRSNLTPANTIEAKLTGDETCAAEGHSVTVGSPVIALCRKLVEAGYDPALRMDVYRGATLALKIRSIGEAARLVCSDAGFARRQDAAQAPNKARPRVLRLNPNP